MIYELSFVYNLYTELEYMNCGFVFSKYRFYYAQNSTFTIYGMPFSKKYIKIYLLCFVNMCNNSLLGDKTFLNDMQCIE